MRQLLLDEIASLMTQAPRRLFRFSQRVDLPELIGPDKITIGADHRYCSIKKSQGRGHSFWWQIINRDRNAVGHERVLNDLFDSVPRPTSLASAYTRHMHGGRTLRCKIRNFLETLLKRCVTNSRCRRRPKALLPNKTGDHGRIIRFSKMNLPETPRTRNTRYPQRKFSLSLWELFPDQFCDFTTPNSSLVIYQLAYDRWPLRPRF